MPDESFQLTNADLKEDMALVIDRSSELFVITKKEWEDKKEKGDLCLICLISKKS
jgi:hypothetical protein